MAELTPDQIKKAQEAGAEVKVIPKQVEVNGLADLVSQLQQMQDAARKGQAVMLTAIQQLTQVIQDKQVSSGTDLSELVAAVSSLKQETELQYAPVEWQLEFERDNRGMLKSGMRFKPVTMMIN